MLFRRRKTQPDDRRISARYTAPAHVEFNGQKFEVYDWSLSGLYVNGLTVQNRKHLTLRLVIEINHMVVGNSIECHVVRQDANGVALKFLNLYPTERAMLRGYIDFLEMGEYPA